LSSMRARRTAASTAPRIPRAPRRPGLVPSSPGTRKSGRRGMATPRKGTGLLMVWADVPADKEAEFNRWYNEEHLAERMSVPGFLNAARYEAVKGGPKHLAVYELEGPAVLESPAYKKVQANPTPWTKRCSPEVIGTTFTRNVYTMIHPRALSGAAAASDLPPALQLARLHAPPDVDAHS